MSWAKFCHLPESCWRTSRKCSTRRGRSIPSIDIDEARDRLAKAYATCPAAGAAVDEAFGAACG